MKRLTAAILATIAGTAYAEEQKHHFDIPAQALGSALQTLAVQSGAQMLYAEQTAAGKQSPRLIGDYTTAEAADKLLADSGLAHSVAANGTVTVKPAPQKQEASALKPMTVKGKRNDINDPYNTNYTRTHSSTATKTDTPIMQTPANIQVVTKAVLDDQPAITIDQALNNVSGVTTSVGSGGLSDDIYLRGFRTTTQFRNGFRYDSEYSSWGERQMANVQSIEVIKGPASVLYGRMEPGGMVNVVTKQPLSTDYYSVQQQIGSYGLYRTSIDATGPLTKDDTLLYRMNMSYENNDTFRELNHSERFFLAPVLKWNMNPRTQATLEMEYRHDNQSNDSMVWPYVNGSFINMPRSRNLMEYSPNHVDDVFVGFNWSHEFNDNWKISNRFATERRKSPDSIAMFGDGTPLVNGMMGRLVAAQPMNIKTNYTTLDLTGHFNTYFLKHTFLMGGDYYNNKSFGSWDNGVAASSINVYNPVHTGITFPTDTFTPYNNGTDFYGLYAQDQIQLPYDVHVMGGLRYQGVKLLDNVADVASPLEHAVSPRVGLLWQPQKWVSLYGNYTENFGASNGQGVGGSQLPPQSAKNKEVGFKTEFFDGRLSSTVAYFELTKTNVATPDPIDPRYSIAVGEVRSRGPEFDIKGEIMPGWNAIATYANLDVVITKDNSGMEGKRMYAVPRNMGSLWNTYDFQQDTLRGLKIGGGISLRDSSTNLPNTYNVPGYATVDLLAAYKLKLNKSKITFQLNVNNLLDRNYFHDVIPGLGTDTRVNIGAPRTLVGSIKVEF